MRIFAICVCVTALVGGVGCERHSAQETKYFATHHLSKAEKALAKEAYARQLEAAGATPAPAPADPAATTPEGRRFFETPADAE